MNDKEDNLLRPRKGYPAGHRAGATVSRAGTPGDEHLFCGPFNFPINYPEKYPDWPVTLEEHRVVFRDSFMEYGKAMGKTPEQTESAWIKFLISRFEQERGA